MLAWVIKMSQCERIDISEGTDTNKTSASKESMLCHYWYFKTISYKFESNVCNTCHDVLISIYDLTNIVTLNVKGVNCTLFCGVLVKMTLLIF